MFGTPMTSANDGPSPEVAADHSSSSVPSQQTIEANRFRVPGKALRPLLFFALVLITTVTGVWTMFDIMSADMITPLEATLLVLFAVTFTWIVAAFWSGAIGFILRILRLDPLSLRRKPGFPAPHAPVTSRTAVVMPIYNEDTVRVMAGFEASLRSLASTGQADKFDFYLLSDSRNPAIAQAELGAWQALIERLGPLSKRVYYRRRENNEGRKVGNLADFCRRWGSYYHSMIVLDADSVMTGDCMLSLVHAMEANPQAGLIQTVPLPVRQQTFFGRFLQFAASLYSPMLATGLAFWQTDSANYWGHNAIIRVNAFMDHCGLPSLSGRGPFSGEILSHDFVEAALLRRAGWGVYLLADLEGSYEEVPSNLLDYATRDRRWVQGNIQHLALLTGKGLCGLSRLHFVLGAVAYISTLVWLTMLGLSTADAITRALSTHNFFSSPHQLFPTWPVDKTGLIFFMFYLTAGLLLLPKLMGVLLALVQRRAAFAGVRRLLAGALMETLFAILIAPLMMVFHSYFVICVLVGRKVNWEAQAREGRMVPWREAVRHTQVATLLALVWGSVTFYLAPTFFWWLVPVLTGLVLAAPIVRYSSNVALGLQMREWGLFVDPSETQEYAVLVDLRHCLNHTPQPLPVASSVPPLLPELWRDMPTQSFDSVNQVPPAFKVTSAA